MEANVKISPTKLALFLAALLLQTFISTLLNGQDSRMLDVRATNMVYHQKTGTLYVITNHEDAKYPSSLIGIDPNNGNVLTAVFLGSQPNIIKIDPKGEFLYIGFKAASKIIKYNPFLQSIEQQIYITPLNGINRFTQDLFFIQNHPDSLAVLTTEWNCQNDLITYNKDIETSRNTIYGPDCRTTSIYFDKTNNQYIILGITSSDINYKILKREKGAFIEIKGSTRIPSFTMGFDPSSIPSSPVHFQNGILTLANGTVYKLINNTFIQDGAFTLTGQFNYYTTAHVPENNTYRFIHGSINSIIDSLFVMTYDSTYRLLSKQYIPKTIINYKGFYPIKMESWEEKEFNALIGIESLGGLFKSNLLITKNCKSYIKDKPEFSSKLPIKICQNTTQLISIVNSENYKVKWSNNPTSKNDYLVTGNQSLGVWFEDTLFCSSPIHEIYIEQFPYVYPPPIEANSNVLCRNGSMEINAFGFIKPYFTIWSTGDTSKTIEVKTPGEYYARLVSPDGCLSDISNIVQIDSSDRYAPEIPEIFPKDTSVCALTTIPIFSPQLYEKYVTRNLLTGEYYTSQSNVFFSYPRIGYTELFQTKVGDEFGCFSQYSDTIRISGKFKYKAPIIFFDTAAGLLRHENADSVAWYVRGNNIPIAFGPFHIPIESNYYFAKRLESKIFCESDISNQVYLTILHSSYLNPTKNFEVFPNPATHEININVLDHNCKEIFIYDLMGVQLKKFNVTPGTMNKIHLTDLPPGVYFIQSNLNEHGNSIKKLILTD